MTLSPELIAALRAMWKAELERARQDPCEKVDTPNQRWQYFDSWLERVTDAVYSLELWEEAP